MGQCAETSFHDELLPPSRPSDQEPQSCDDHQHASKKEQNRLDKRHNYQALLTLAQALHALQDGLLRRLSTFHTSEQSLNLLLDLL